MYLGCPEEVEEKEKEREDVTVQKSSPTMTNAPCASSHEASLSSITVPLSSPLLLSPFL